MSQPEGSKVPLLRFWLLIFLGIPAVATASVSWASFPESAASLEQREHKAWKALTHSSEFVDIRHLSARSRCEQVQPPQALTTPSPLLTLWRERRIKISFIVGIDGRVHSPLILESAGPAPDRHVLQTVRTWRYRPGTCNGVPTETEGKVEFSSR